METQSFIEDIDEITRKIKVVIPLERVQQETDSAISEAAKTAHLKGFRPGKAPRDVIEKTHGPRLRLEVANRLISSSLNEIIKKHQMDIVGNPEIDMADYKPDQPIEFTASVALYPKPEIKGYEKIKVQVIKKEVKDQDIEDVLKNIRKSKSTLKPVEGRDVVQSGDVVDALISIEAGGKEEARPEPLAIEVGEGKITADIENAFIGMKVGETKKVAIPASMTENEDDKKDGTQSYYVLKLEKISERLLPELDDDLVATLDMEPKTLLELRMDIRKNLEKKAENESQSELHAALLDNLVKANEFRVPQIMVDNEIYNLLVKSGQIKEDNADIKIEDFRSALNPIAEQRVRTAVIIDRIAEQEKIELKEEDIQKELEQMASDYRVSKEDMTNYLVKNKLLNGFLIEMRRSRTIDMLAGKAEVEYSQPAGK